MTRRDAIRSESLPLGFSSGSGVVKARALNQQGIPAGGIVPQGAGQTGITDGSGPVLTSVRLFLIFWGSAWSRGTTASADAVVNAVTRILFGPYMSALGQYRGITEGSLLGTRVVDSSDPPNPFSDDQVQKFVIGQIQAKLVPNPHSDNEIFFCVIMPPGVQFTKADYSGAHSFITRDFTNPFGVLIPVAWVTNDGMLESVTITFSHELVEACTDPNGNAFQITNPPAGDCQPGTWCEIGDVCEGFGSDVWGVQVTSYWSGQDGGCIVPKGLVRGEVSGNPVLIQGRFAGRGNFELVTPLAAGGLAHYSRSNDLPFVPWFGPATFGQDVGRFDAIGMIQSNFTAGPGIGNLEVVARFGGDLLYYYRDDVPPYTWHGPVTMNGFSPRLFTGNPVLIQGRFEQRGNFELVVPLADGGLAHYDRANNETGVPWYGPNVFATELGRFDAVIFVQNNLTEGANKGELELIGLSQGELFFYVREDIPPYQWFGPLRPAGFVQQIFSGNPVLIQGRFAAGGSTFGNYELVVPLAAGGLAHYYRANQEAGRPWHGPTIFGQDVGRFDAISLIQSNFSAGAGIGNLELVARLGEELVTYWRDDTSPFAWYGPCPIVA